MRIVQTQEILIEGLDAQCLALTWELYNVLEGDDVLYQIGFMQTSALDITSYAWCAPTGVVVPLSAVRQVRGEFKKLVGNRPGNLIAEAAVDSPRDQKFLTFLGFQLVRENFHGVNIYEWSI